MANMVFYELNDSPFFLRIDDFMFTFSSKLYKDKFIKNYKEYIRNETLKLNVKYNSLVYADEMLLLSLYKKIEKRGFYVKYKGSLLEKDYYIDCKINEEYSHTVKEWLYGYQIW